MYAWNNEHVVPVIFQVHEENTLAIPFYKKLNCTHLLAGKRNSHPFNSLKWTGDQEPAKRELLRNWKNYGLYDAKDTGMHHYEMPVKAIKQLDKLLESYDIKRYGKEQISKEEWQQYKKELGDLETINSLKYKLHYLDPTNATLKHEYY